jgi:DNA-binding NarL/FixJ family response regulator
MRILIIDDHPLYIRGIQALLQELAPGVITDTAGTVETALQLAARERPDLILLDLKLPGSSGLDGLTRVREAMCGVPVIVVSGTDNSEHAWRAIEMGAAGYIPKDTDPSRMGEALGIALRCGVYLPAGTVSAAISDCLGTPPPQLERPKLTERQLIVLQALLQGKSNKVIGHHLNIAEGTVKNHLWCIYQALGVSSRLQVMARAHELGLIDGFKGFSPAA